VGTTSRQAWRPLLRDTRGANLVEYVVLVGLVALLAMGGVRWFGQRADAKARGQAACVESFDCGPGDTAPYALVDGDQLAFKAMQAPAAQQAPSATPSPPAAAEPAASPAPAPAPTALADPTPSPGAAETPTPAASPAPAPAPTAVASPTPSPGAAETPTPSASPPAATPTAVAAPTAASPAAAETPTPADSPTQAPAASPAQAAAPSPAPTPVDPKQQALARGLLAAQQAEGLAGDAAAADAISRALLAGDTSNAARDRIAAYFQPLGVTGSNQAMQAIRDAQLMSPFLDTTLRAADGQSVDPRVRLAVEKMMNSARLDVYAETLATRPISLYDPKDPRFEGAAPNHHFHPGAPGKGMLWWAQAPVEKGVYFNKDALDASFKDTVPGQASHGLAVDSLANTMAHEVYHAYHDAHGGPNGAVNEGMGIAAFNYAYQDGPYDLAEMIYGTKNFYRDVMQPPDPNYALTAGTGDPELTAFMAQIASRDSSGVAYDNQARLDAEYTNHWKDLKRSDGEWASKAAKATADMKAAREAKAP
jgi:Flp pilus assembly pilin Flp